MATLRIPTWMFPDGVVCPGVSHPVPFRDGLATKSEDSMSKLNWEPYSATWDWAKHGDYTVFAAKKPDPKGVCASIRSLTCKEIELVCVNVTQAEAREWCEKWLANRERQANPLHSLSLGNDGSATIFNASGKVIGRAVGVVTKPTGHLPCNCGAPPDSPFDWHHRDCNARMCEVSLQPTKCGTDGFVKAGERESDEAYRKRLIAYVQQTMGHDPNRESRLLSATGNALDDVGAVSFGIRRHGSDLPTNAPVNPKASITASAMEDIRRDIHERYNHWIKAGYIDKAAFEKAGGFGALIARVDSDSKPSLRERLARELRLDPCADEEVVFSTAAKRLAGQYDALDTATGRNAELVMRADAAQRRVESLLHDLSTSARENDELRAIVAEQELRLRKGGKR
jgi:hypothetical protein